MWVSSRILISSKNKYELFLWSTHQYSNREHRKENMLPATPGAAQGTSWNALPFSGAYSFYQQIPDSEINSDNVNFLAFYRSECSWFQKVPGLSYTDTQIIVIENCLLYYWDLLFVILEKCPFPTFRLYAQSVRRTVRIQKYISHSQERAKFLCQWAGGWDLSLTSM